MYACQIYRAAEKDLPSLAEDVAAGRFAPLRAWLREKIHKVRRALACAPFLAGSRRPDALLACACGVAPPCSVAREQVRACSTYTAVMV